MLVSIDWSIQSGHWVICPDFWLCLMTWSATSSSLEWEFHEASLRDSTVSWILPASKDSTTSDSNRNRMNWTIQTGRRSNKPRRLIEPLPTKKQKSSLQEHRLEEREFTLIKWTERMTNLLWMVSRRFSVFSWSSSWERDPITCPTTFGFALLNNWTRGFVVDSSREALRLKSDRTKIDERFVHSVAQSRRSRMEIINGIGSIVAGR